MPILNPTDKFNWHARVTQLGIKVQHILLVACARCLNKKNKGIRICGLIFLCSPMGFGI